MAEYVDSVFLIQDNQTGQFLINGRANKVGWKSPAAAKRGLVESFPAGDRYPNGIFEKTEVQQERWFKKFDAAEEKRKAKWIAGHTIIEVTDNGVIGVR